MVFNSALISLASWPLLPSMAVGQGHKRNSNGRPQHIVSSLPHEDPVVLASLPATWDWRFSNGVDYTGPILNQHQPGPSYCGSCWAFSTVSHLNARFNILRQNAWPRTELNVQVLVTCGPGMPAGCDGSEPTVALKFIHEYGLPHESCRTYDGKDGVCDAYSVCQDCMTGFLPHQCWARDKFPIFRVKEYGSILPNGNISIEDPAKRQLIISDMVTRMKAEIWKRGPIVCQIACPEPHHGKATSSWPVPETNRSIFGDVRGYMGDYTPFFNMAGENFDPFVMHNTDFTCPNGDWDSCVDHDVTVVGWGVEDGVEHWIIQNSWGEWWGEGGFFRIVTGLNNLGIESACFFGIPDVDEIKTDAHGFQRFPMGTSAVYADRYEKFKSMSAPHVVYM